MEPVAEKNLIEAGIVLPNAPAPLAAYVPCVQTGHLVFVSGQGTVFNGTRLYLGAVGRERTPEEGYAAARVCALNLLAQLREYLGSLDRVSRVVNLRGYVNSAEDFTGQPAIINGASDLLCQVFGPEIGRHSRTALGVPNLPNGITAEVELIVEIDSHSGGKA